MPISSWTNWEEKKERDGNVRGCSVSFSFLRWLVWSSGSLGRKEGDWVCTGSQVSEKTASNMARRKRSHTASFHASHNRSQLCNSPRTFPKPWDVLRDSDVVHTPRAPRAWLQPPCVRGIDRTGGVWSRSEGRCLHWAGCQGAVCAHKQAAFHVKTNSCWKHSENAVETYEFADKKEKKRTFGTVMDENQGWILSGESGHWEQRLLALHLRHDSCFSQIAKGSASQGWVGLRESETNGNYDIPEQKGREDMFTSRLYNVKQREALDSRRLQHLLKGISHLAHKSWVSAAFHLCVYAIMRQEHPKFTRDL